VTLTIIPLIYDFSLDISIFPLELHIQRSTPRKPRWGYKKNLDYEMKGHPLDTAIDLLESWIKAFNPHHRIIPIVWKAEQQLPFIQHMLGPFYEHVFSEEYRCVRQATLWVNDLSSACGENIPFPRDSLGRVAGRLGISPKRPATSLAANKMTVDVYAKLRLREASIRRPSTELYSILDHEF
jgi:hypothetical protein